MNILEADEPVTKAQLEDLESTIGHRLPAAYRKFLLENNGGRPVPNVIDINSSPAGATVVHVFLGITAEFESETLAWSWTTFSGRIPERFLPIADDSFGNFFCLSLSGVDQGQIWFCDRYEDEGSPPHFVAPDFPSFVAKMRELTPAEIATIASHPPSSTPEPSS